MTKLNATIGESTRALEFTVPIETTAAVVLGYTDHFRLLVVGDSAVRINSTQIYTQPMKVDEVSIAVRVAIWRCLRESATSDAQAEAMTRKVFVHGLKGCPGPGRRHYRRSARHPRCCCQDRGEGARSLPRRLSGNRDLLPAPIGEPAIPPAGLPGAERRRLCRSGAGEKLRKGRCLLH